jgi:hypothetical protein
METILNLIWLAVTVAAIWLWRFRWSVSRQNPRHGARMEVVAIVCVLALLFPVISLTDDLHPDMVPADTVSSKRNLCLLVAHTSQAANSKLSLHAHHFPALVSLSTAAVEFSSAGVVLIEPILQPRCASTPGIGRAPPSLA